MLSRGFHFGTIRSVHRPQTNVSKVKSIGRLYNEPPIPPNQPVRSGYLLTTLDFLIIPRYLPGKLTNYLDAVVPDAGLMLKGL